MKYILISIYHVYEGYVHKFSFFLYEVLIYRKIDTSRWYQIIFFTLIFYLKKYLIY